MKNQIFRISKSEKEKAKNDLLNSGLFVAEIESECLKNDESFMKELSLLFKFPYVVTNPNALNDYMTDLDWLNNDMGYSIIINNFHQIACKSYDEGIRNAELNFAGMISWLYYWEDDVERVTGYWDEETQTFSGGMSPKKFDIYLVD